MDRFVVFLLWLVLIVGAAVAFDQVMVRVPFHAPVLVETQIFYRDFRTRLISLRHERKSPPATIEGVIERHSSPEVADKPKKQEKAAPQVVPAPPPAAAVPRKAAEGVKKGGEASLALEGYVYADKDGVLHMVSRWEEVPQGYRGVAQPLNK